MASIELTTTNITLAITTIGSLLTATWALSRRSQSWDFTELHHKLLYGDEKERDPILNRGLLEVLRDHLGARNLGDSLPESSFRQALTLIASNAEQIKKIQRGTGAHGSDEHAIGLAFRKTITSEVELVVEDLERERARAARLRVLQEQAQRFDDARTEADPFPPKERLSTGQNRTARAVLPQAAIPREDEPDDRPSRPSRPRRP